MPDEGASAEESINWEELLAAPATDVSPNVKYLLFGGYAIAGGLSLSGGILLGMRSFESSDAKAALDKFEKPTVAAERLAMQTAIRAFGWGTAVAQSTMSHLTFLYRRSIPSSVFPATSRDDG